MRDAKVRPKSPEGFRARSAARSKESCFVNNTLVNTAKSVP